MKPNPILIIFAIIYNIITVIFILNMMNDQSGSLGYVIIFFPIFWIISGVILFLFKWKKLINFEGISDKILLFFSTPFALILFYFIYVQSTDAKYIRGQYEYDKGNYRYKEITYEYENAGQNQRKEFYILDGEWKKDSIWTYYNKDGSIEKVEDFRNKSNMK